MSEVALEVIHRRVKVTNFNLIGSIVEENLVRRRKAHETRLRIGYFLFRRKSREYY